MNQTLTTASVKANPKAKRPVGRSVLPLRAVPSLSQKDRSFFTAVSTSDRFSVAFAKKLFVGAAEKACA